MRNFRTCDRVVQSLVLLIIAGLISGCAGTAMPFAEKQANHPVSKLQPIDPTQPHSGTVRFFGFVDVSRDPEDADQEFEARFGRFDQPIPADILIAAFAPPLPDTCKTSDKKNPISEPDEAVFEDNPHQFVDAGEAVRIFFSGRRYTSLEPRTVTDEELKQEIVTYAANVNSLRTTFAGFKLFDARIRVDNLSVLIPGGSFPQFGPVEIPSAHEVSGFSLGATDLVTADTQIRWRRASNPKAIVELSAGGGGRAVFCSAKDDGHFSLPPKIAQWLGKNSIPNPEAYRESTAIYRQGEAVLVVSQSTGL